jgi:predicted 3-demethylubiquinone-9 3-methyltransferase (glyoxalase superfamily)
MQKITPFLWFDGRAEEAANFYTSVFKDARIADRTRYGEGGLGPKGALMSATIEIAGLKFIAFNGGPLFKFSPAISFSVSCETQDEVDRYWHRLSEGGETRQCGWLTDKFGVTWQIVPTALPVMLGDNDPEKSRRVMQAMLKMTKLEIAELRKAYEGV